MNESAIIYPVKSGCKNVLLIDNTIKDVKMFTNSVNSNTLPIIYSRTSTKIELLNVLKANFTTINRIGLCFTSLKNTKTFLDNKPFFEINENSTGPFSENVEFLISIIKKFNVKNIDWLACDTLNYPNWVNFYNILKCETNIIIGASNNKTGNIKYDGDWLLESTSQNIERIYFTKSIEYYTYLFDDIQEWATLDTPFGLYIAINNEYLYLRHNDSPNITQINLNDPTDQIIIELNFAGSYIGFYNNDMYIINTDDNSIEKIISLNPLTYEVYATDLSNQSRELIVHENYMYIITNTGIDRINLLNETITVESNWYEIVDILSIFISNDFIYTLRIIKSDKIFQITQVSLEDPTITLIVANLTYSLNNWNISDNYIYLLNAMEKTIYKMDLTKTLEFVTQNNKPLTIEDDPDSQIISIWKETQFFPMSIVFDSTYAYVMEIDFDTGKTTISRFDLPQPSISLNNITTIIQSLNKYNKYNNLELSQTFQNSKKTRSTINLFVKAINLFA
jgi:hypothetical protein